MARILIADDEDLERKALRMIIQKEEGIPSSEIDEAENGAEVIQRAAATRYDAIFLDIMMPGVDGLAAAKTLRDRGINSPIVILSAFDTFEYAQRAIRLGVYEYLLKPAGSEEVLRALRRSLEKVTERDIRTKIEDLSIRLRESIKLRLAQEDFDSPEIEDYERLLDLFDTPRAAVALRIIPKEACSKQVMAAVFDEIESRARRLCEGHTKAFLWGSSEETAYLVTYASTGEAIPPSGDDPFENFLMRLGQVVYDIIPADTRIGVSGPLVSLVGELLSKARDALALCSSDSPLVRLVPADAKVGEAWLGSASASPGSRSLGLKALNYLREHYMEDLTLAKVAESMSVNASYLSHVIPKELGIGFNELLNRLRVQRAKDLMSAGASVKEASYLVGFSDQAYFTRVFKRMEGEVPRRFMGKIAKKYK